MKVLFYNWVDYLDPEGRGGGASIYQRNVIEALEREGDVDPWFLSSGISYDLVSDRPRWEAVRHGPRKAAGRRFEIVNSGCLAPGHASFGHESQVSHAPTEAAFFDFLKANGPFDVVHFTNLEGVPAAVLGLKAHAPSTRIVLSLHNYYPICPQVNLWQREEAHCDDFDHGRRCVTCLPEPLDATEVRTANAVAYRLKRAGLAPGMRAFGPAFRAGVRVANGVQQAVGPVWPDARRAATFAEEATASPRSLGGLLHRLEPDHTRFARRRARIVELANAHVDLIHCVSARTMDVAARHGLRRDLMRVSYIGTPHAEAFERTEPRKSLLQPDGTLRLGFLGYMRRDKGFTFLLDALEALPARMASRLHLVVAARAGSRATMHRLQNLGATLASVRHANGYAHGDLDALAGEIDAGIVPGLWEDNLPQVAIELHARHVPLITSSRGGAQELAACHEMVFEAGNVQALHAVVSRLLSGEIDLNRYWAGARPPISMNAHVAALKALYNEPSQEGTSAVSSMR